MMSHQEWYNHDYFMNIYDILDYEFIGKVKKQSKSFTLIVF